MATPHRIGGTALAALLADPRSAPGAVYTALAGNVRLLVLDGRIATGTRLPSERDLAGALRLSRATVTAAYDELRLGGFLTSRTGAGSFATIPDGYALAPGPVSWRAPAGDPDTPGSTDVIDFANATVPAAEGVAAALAEAVEAVAAYLPLGGYEPAGLAVLRQAVADRYTQRGAPTSPDQILVTNGALHGLDLVLRLLLGPGDRVLAELPSYPGALDAVAAHHGRVVPVPMNPTGGWQVGQLRAAMRHSSPRLAYLMPDFHNPTGALLPTDARRELLIAARQTGTTVVVDETFAELDFGEAGPARPVAALDDSVISLGSLSKPVWTGLRIGWLRAPAELVRRLTGMRTVVDLSSPVLEQLAGASLLGRMDELAAARVAQLRPQRDALLGALGELLPQWRPSVPAGGLSTWIELDAPVSTPLVTAAAQAGVLLVPGSRFGVDGALERFLRVPYALPPARLREAVVRIAAARDRLAGGAVPPERLVVT